MGRAERQRLPEDMCAAEAISRISSTDGVRGVFT